MVARRLFAAILVAVLGIMFSLGSAQAAEYYPTADTMTECYAFDSLTPGMTEDTAGRLTRYGWIQYPGDHYYYSPGCFAA